MLLLSTKFWLQLPHTLHLRLHLNHVGLHLHQQKDVANGCYITCLLNIVQLYNINTLLLARIIIQKLRGEWIKRGGGCCFKRQNHYENVFNSVFYMNGCLDMVSCIMQEIVLKFSHTSIPDGSVSRISLSVCLSVSNHFLVICLTSYISLNS